jgi:tripeptidyl-peptidase-1
MFRLTAVAATLALAAAAPAREARLVAEPEVSAALGWAVGARTVGEVSFSVSVNQQNLDKLRQVVFEVSDPDHVNYGQYLKQAEIDELTAPTASDLNAVTGWLRAAGASFTLAGTHTAEVTAPVAVAEAMLSTTWHTLVNAKTGQSVDRAAGYTVPAEVAGSIAALHSVHGLPLPPKARLAARPGTPYKVTPAVITKQYGVSGVTPSAKGNSMAVAEFQGQFMIPANLVKFFKRFVPDSTADTVSKFMGDANGRQEGVEADLDIQYIMGTAPGIATEFWEEKGNDFCKDLKKWTELLLSTDACPLVNSVSYGWQGKLTQIQCNIFEWKDVDTNFMKLAAKGITVVFASGDSGSGSTNGKLYPSWPASSEFVTSVGATRFVDQTPGEEMASDQFGSGGGFCSFISRGNATWQEKAVTNYLNSDVKLPKASSYTATGRATPDVSGLGEGYQVETGPGGIQSVGGTSASTPMFAGLVGLINDARLQKGMPAMGFMNPFIYKNADAFTDVTKGTNGIDRGGEKCPGFPAAPGWDPATGLGTPIFSKLLAAAMAAGDKSVAAAEM